MDIKDSKIEIFDLILERNKLQKKIDESNSLMGQKLQELDGLQVELQAQINEINSLIEQKLKELDELQAKEK